jgi:PAS domain S-box-containing protein
MESNTTGLAEQAGILVCGISEGSVDNAIKSDINIKMLTDLAPSIIWTRSKAGKITFVNNYWFDYIGAEPVPIDEVVWLPYIHPDDIETFEAKWLDAREKDGEYKAELRLRRADGQFLWFLTHGRPVRNDQGKVTQWMGSATMINDLKVAQAEAAALQAQLESKVAERTAELEETNRQLMEEIVLRQVTQDALRQSQKMEAVGQLTGGIAHDFNNMLTVVIGNLELMKMSLPNLEESPITKRIDRNVAMAIEAALKAEKLTAQLLAFSRKSRLHPERLNVNYVIDGVIDMVERAVGQKIRCTVDLQDEVWLCLSDKTQLESALVNLAINARDAMPNGGDLCLKTQNKSVEGPQGDIQYVSVSVSDTGTGMDTDTLTKAFEPFFTTKDVGKGSGLGLSMVYGFTQQSNGKVYITSELGRGTTVEMLFPYTAGESIATTRDSEDFHYDGNKLSILVVDDEPGVRELACQLLSDIGYNTLSAEDGNKAIKILEDKSIPIDLLFTDVVMPNGVDGFGVARAAGEVRPGMPIIFTTGHAEIALRELKKDLTQKIKVLGKPYRLNELSSMVATELQNQETKDNTKGE